MNSELDEVDALENFSDRGLVPSLVSDDVARLAGALVAFGPGTVAAASGSGAPQRQITRHVLDELGCR